MPTKIGFSGTKRNTTGMRTVIGCLPTCFLPSYRALIFAGHNLTLLTYQLAGCNLIQVYPTLDGGLRRNGNDVLLFSCQPPACVPFSIQHPGAQPHNIGPQRIRSIHNAMRQQSINVAAGIFENASPRNRGTLASRDAETQPKRHTKKRTTERCQDRLRIDDGAAAHGL